MADEKKVEAKKGEAKVEPKKEEQEKSIKSKPVEKPLLTKYTIDILGPCGSELWLNYKGIHNFDALYKLMWEWFKNRGYVATADGSENIEEYYSEVILSGGAKKNLWFYWRTKKTINEMFEYYINLDCQLLVHGPEEIVLDNKKIKMHNGEITIKLTANLVVDPENSWAQNTIMYNSFAWMKRNHYKSLIDARKDELYDHVTGLFEVMKHHIGLLTYSDLGPQFHPEKGVPQLQ